MLFIGTQFSILCTSAVLAGSSAEAEFIALCACAADVAYCRRLANELGFLQLRPTSIIYEDNVCATQIAESGNFKGRAKHFELRWQFLHHCINELLSWVWIGLQMSIVGRLFASMHLRSWMT